MGWGVPKASLSIYKNLKSVCLFVVCVCIKFECDTTGAGQNKRRKMKIIERIPISMGKAWQKNEKNSLKN